VQTPKRDYDGDGCNDANELWAGTPGGWTTCGDDPWNPNDTPSGSPLNVTGSWDIVMQRTSADVGAPGYYYNCKADIAQSGTSLTAPIVCYADNPGVTANPQAAGGNPTSPLYVCPPAAARFCGDGLPGAAPPGCAQAGQSPAVACATLAAQGSGCPTLPCDTSQYQFADIDGAHTVVSGTMNTTTKNIDLSGCYQDLDGYAPGQVGHMYVQASINAYTGLGSADLFVNQPANCGGSPIGSPIPASIFAVRQNSGVTGGTEPAAVTFDSLSGTWPECGPNAGPGYSLCRDSDGDGCPDQVELKNAQGSGGLRDPLNRWDLFNPEKVNTPHKQTVSDILKVNAQYGINQGNPAYTIDTDRTVIIGGNVWTLGPPDGQQTVADTLAANKQYNHNC
jgi:hypothetical protein